MDDCDVDISTVLPQKDVLKSKKKKSGGFQSMGLSWPILQAILKKGYKVPTPIQRKAIPVILQGKNVIAMARTGSGKTAAFLVPMLEKLKCRVAKSGARALIFSPTRELAIQTMKFTRELGIKTDLKTALVLGGEKIEDQFAAIHESPDIIIATPGRFLHVVMEMNLTLLSIKYVVFDEADRLFEMGFQEQLQEVLRRLFARHQTLLFSATLPKVLVDFVKAGIEDPVLIRLDVDWQISEGLKSFHLLCRNEDKPAALLYLLKNIINLRQELTVVFLPTKHHIEYLRNILEKADISCSYIYSSLDQMARKIHIAKFRFRKVNVLLVTDIAARGLDIPLLDNVINYNFPAKPKLYVHRVGRVARAGRSGKAFSIVSVDETPYLLDLHLFLGKPLKFAKPNMEDEDCIVGAVPQNIIEDESEVLYNWHKLSADLTSMQKVVKNASKKYITARPAPSRESIRRMKEFSFSTAEIHPIFKDSAQNERNKILAEMKSYRPNTTIFELGPLAKTQASVVMRQKRKSHIKLLKTETKSAFDNKESYVPPCKALEKADEKDLMGFTQHVTIEENLSQKKKQKNGDYKDNEHYVPYVSAEHYKEKGLGLESSFTFQAAGAVLDLTKDDDDGASAPKKRKNMKFWDRKKKKFVQAEATKKIQTESGAWIPRGYKTGLYKKWQEMNKIKYQVDNEVDGDEESQFGKNRIMLPKGKKHRNKDESQKSKPLRREMKTAEEILKARKIKERLVNLNRQKQKQQARTKKPRKSRRK